MRLGNLLFRLMLYALYGSALACILFFAWQGFDYFITPYSQRPHHADYLIFKPAGRWGLRFAVIGTSMMLGLLLYVFRKRTPLFGEMFSLSSWLSVHIFFGIAGPLFILLHTSFKLNGIVAISFWAMILVAMSGVLGRYLYIQIPQNKQGDLQDLENLETEIASLANAYQARRGSSSVAFEECLASLSKEGNAGSLLSMIKEDLVQPFRWIGLSGKLTRIWGLSKQDKRDLLPILRRKIKLERRIVRLDRIYRLFHYWHLLHRPIAAVMYLFMMIHIVVALLFGISWKEL